MQSATFINSCVAAWNAGDLSNCKPFGLDIQTWVALATAVAGVTFFFGRKALRKIGQLGLDGRPVWLSFGRSRFSRLCRAISPLMRENSRIFATFGPNSGASGRVPKKVRTDLGIWYESRNKVVENNAKIRSLINENELSIPSEYRPIFSSWLSHIDAFEAHVADESVDYTDHQFPREIVEIVNGNS